MEIDLGVATLEAIVVIRVVAISSFFGLEAFDGRIGLDQGAIDREVFDADQPGLDGAAHRPVEKVSDQPVGLQAFAVVRKDRGVKNLLIDPQVQKPAEQKIVINAFDELGLGANGIERLKKHRFDQPLGRNAGPALIGIGGIKPPVHLPKVVIGHTLDGP
jgi:hypothetical protein